jgi:hypothetical protein
MTQRTLRVDELLREEISRIVSREIEDPRVGFVTITRVEARPTCDTALLGVIGTAATEGDDPAPVRDALHPTSSRRAHPPSRSSTCGSTTQPRKAPGCSPSSTC